MIDVLPVGMNADDLKAIRDLVLGSAPGARGALWYWSEATRTLLVGEVVDRRMRRWLMQPAEDEPAARGVANKWLELLSSDQVASAVLSAMSTSKPGGAVH